jgi:hypothetical protein
MEDVLRVTRGYPKIKFRHIIMPTEDPPEVPFPPIFTTVDNIEKEIALGYSDGLKAIEAAKQFGSNLHNFDFN